MDNRPGVVLDGNHLTIDDVVAIGTGAKRVELDENALFKVQGFKSLS